jgi:hypothetical protein
MEGGAGELRLGEEGTVMAVETGDAREREAGVFGKGGDVVRD